MEKDEQIDKVYITKEAIKQIVDRMKKYSFEDYTKPLHYELSLMSKGTDEQELRKIYPKFELIKMIMLRKRKSGYENYDIYYELGGGNYALFAVNFNSNKKPRMDNAFIANKIFKNFLKIVIKRYGKEMV
ncbi:hypothetical protein GOV13_04645 [Candidatus Pacearchaeota archaeon]|nr:hypothetical protein [Candidatus Pacearchaeota archaeon]